MRSGTIPASNVIERYQPNTVATPLVVSHPVVLPAAAIDVDLRGHYPALIVREGEAASMPHIPWPTNPIRVFVLTVLVALTAAIAGTMVTRGKMYTNQLAHCQHVDSDDQFCGITTLPLELPVELRHQIMTALPSTQDLAVRAYIPGVRAGRTVLTSTMIEQLPDVVRWYESAKQHISATVGEDVYPTDLSLPTSCCLIVYDREGDGIDWHYDINYFMGRFFTVLVPVNMDRTCSVFVYRDAYGVDRQLELQSPEYAGRAVVFEGTLVYHKATPLCAGQQRVVLSLQYATDARLTVWNRLMTFVKDRAFAGLGFLDFGGMDEWTFDSMVAPLIGVRSRAP